MKNVKETAKTVSAKAVKTEAKIGPKMAKFNRILANAFRLMLFKKMKKATVKEVGLEGIFSKIEAEKKKVVGMIEAQTALVEERKKDIKEMEEESVQSIKDLEAKIAKLKEKNDAKIAKLKEKRDAEKKQNDDESKKILAEQERGKKIVENINKFYGITE